MLHVLRFAVVFITGIAPAGSFGQEDSKPAGPAGSFGQEDAKPAAPAPFLYDRLLPEDQLLHDERPVWLRGHEQTQRTIAEGRKLVAAAQEASGVRDQFAGNWELVSYESMNRDGQMEKRGMTGRIMYDAEGNMAAQLMPEGIHEGERVEGYIAYFGTYSIDEDAHSVSHHVKGSNVARWVGTDLVRYYEFADGMLTLSLKRGDVVSGRLVWKRLS